MAYLYPYGDTQQLNLDWLIEQWNDVKSQIDGSLQAEIDKVEAAITDLLTARDEAVAAQTAAQASAQAAAGSASTASEAASTATAQAQAANASAATAGAHASDAQGYAATAQQSAQAANNSAGAAAVSEGNARNSETAAAGSSSAAAGNALYAEGYAKGTQNGNPVSSGSPYYENNAKYYADQAAQDAQSAQDVLDSIPEDYTELSNDVSNLKTTIDDITIPVNLFDGVIVDGFISQNGEFISQNTSKCTVNFINVKSGSVYTYTSGKFIQIAEYNNNKEFLNRVTDYNVSQYTPPANVAYIKLVSWGINQGFFGDTFMFIQGNTLPTEYIPYGSSYVDSEKIYGLNEKIDLVEALIAPVLTEMKADTALTVNDFRIVNNTLYRITAPVASGGTLTPGTNCTATTITAILKTLL